MRNLIRQRARHLISLESRILLTANFACDARQSPTGFNRSLTQSAEVLQLLAPNGGDVVRVMHDEPGCDTWRFFFVNNSEFNSSLRRQEDARHAQTS